MATIFDPWGAIVQLSIGRALLAGTAAGVVAAIVNVLLFATGAIDQSVETPAGGPITAAPVIMFSLVPNIIGGAVFWALRNATTPIRLWRIIVVLVTVVSFVTPFQLASAPTGMVVTLLVMHVVAGIAAALVTPAVASGQPATRA